MRPQRVLVTGGGGFIGSYVVRLLRASGRDVAVLSRVGHSSRTQAPLSTEVAIIPYVTGEGSRLRRSIRDWAPNACIHLAWHVEPGTYLNSPENFTSLTSSLEILMSVIDAGCDRIAMAGTCAEYAPSHERLKEDSPTRPETIYAATKLSLGLIADRLAAEREVRLAWGRIFFPYGPGEDARRAVPSLIRALLAEQPFPATMGEQVRDYIYVEDVASAFIALIDADMNGVFNISSGVPVSMREVMETIGAILGASELITFGALPYRAWDPMFICGDNARLRTTGWQPTYSLNAGLEQTVAWWRAQVESTPEHRR
jgi:nucleoside-diphosphate-sugar epimerase